MQKEISEETAYTEEARNRRKRALKVSSVLLIPAVFAGIAFTGANWVDEESVGQQFSSSDNFDIEISVDGRGTWDSGTVSTDESNGEESIDFAQLNFDGPTTTNGTPAFSPGQSQSAEFSARVSGENDSRAVFWISDAGVEGNPLAYEWEISSDDEVIASGEELGFIDFNDVEYATSDDEVIDFVLTVTSTGALSEGSEATGYWVIAGQEENAWNHEQD